MHVQTHIMSGWCLGNLFSLTSRERFLCILAASLPDIDGIGKISDLFGGSEFYFDYHHVICHNLLAGIIMSFILAVFSQSHIKAFIIYLVLFHIHILMDYFGSGPLWEIYYLWPFSREGMMTDYAWEFFSWQNILTALVFLMWTIAIIFKKHRTPLEYIMPKLDRQIVDTCMRRSAKKSDSEK